MLAVAFLVNNGCPLRLVRSLAVVLDTLEALDWCHHGVNFKTRRLLDLLDSFKLKVAAST